MSDRNTNIIEEFRANEGRVGAPFEGVPMILIHHLGAKTGVERINPLVYFPDGKNMVIIASKNGAPTNPDWYYNLMAHPRINVEVGTETFTVDVTRVEDVERQALWARIVERMPGFADYQRKVSRQIPLLRLTRVRPFARVLDMSKVVDAFGHLGVS